MSLKYQILTRSNHVHVKRHDKWREPMKIDFKTSNIVVQYVFKKMVLIWKRVDIVSFCVICQCVVYVILSIKSSVSDECCVRYYNMVRWISAPGTMHFCPQYDTFWPCGLFTLLQFCKHPPSKISMKLRWVSSVNLVNCGDIFNLLTILSSPEINDSF